jgi:hypothetical protein
MQMADNFQHPLLGLAAPSAPALPVDPDQSEESRERSGEREQIGVVVGTEHMTECFLERLDQHFRLPRVEDQPIGSVEQHATVVARPSAREVKPEDCPWRLGISAVRMALAGRQKDGISCFHRMPFPPDPDETRSIQTEDKDMVRCAMAPIHMVVEGVIKPAEVGRKQPIRYRIRAGRFQYGRGNHDQSLAGKSLAQAGRGHASCIPQSRGFVHLNRDQDFLRPAFFALRTALAGATALTLRFRYFFGTLRSLRTGLKGV